MSYTIDKTVHVPTNNKLDIFAESTLESWQEAGQGIGKIPAILSQLPKGMKSYFVDDRRDFSDKAAQHYKKMYGMSGPIGEITARTIGNAAYFIGKPFSEAKDNVRTGVGILATAKDEYEYKEGLFATAGGLFVGVSAAFGFMQANQLLKSFSWNQIVPMGDTLAIQAIHSATGTTTVMATAAGLIATNGAQAITTTADVGEASTLPEKTPEITTIAEREAQLTAKYGYDVHVVQNVDDLKHVGDSSKYVLVKTRTGQRELRVGPNVGQHRDMVMAGEEVVGAGYFRIRDSRLIFDGESGAFPTHLRRMINPEKEYVIASDAGLRSVEQHLHTIFDDGIEIGLGF